MEEHQLQSLIEELHKKYVPLDGGDVATYIPELAKADPGAFGICMVTADGEVFQTGDSDRPVSIQSMSKAFTFGLAIQELRQERVLGHVGVEPSGDAFNAIELEPGTNRPYNPM